MARDIIVYEEDDESHMFGFKDHMGHITIFEIRKVGIGYGLYIEGEKPDWIRHNGKPKTLGDLSLS